MKVDHLKVWGFTFPIESFFRFHLRMNLFSVANFVPLFFRINLIIKMMML